MEKTNNVTLYESDFYDSEETKEETKKLIVFRISNEWYAIDTLKTKEVTEVKKITFLPSSPEQIIGIVNLRGTILSITDLTKILNLTREEITDKARFIVIENRTFQTGILADEVLEIIDVPLSKMKPTLSTIAPEKAYCLEGECKIDGRLIGILNVNKLLEKN